MTIFLYFKEVPGFHSSAGNNGTRLSDKADPRMPVKTPITPKGDGGVRITKLSSNSTHDLPYPRGEKSRTLAFLLSTKCSSLF